MQRLIAWLTVIGSVGLVACSGTTYTYNTQSAPENPQAWRAQAEQKSPLPPTGALVERYSDHLFDGPAGQNFHAALSQHYRELARQRDNANDYGDAGKFLQRAGAAARGERVWPEAMEARILPAYSLPDLIYSRVRLMRAFDRGADQQYPRQSARAQVAFDCWMEGQEENRVPDWIHRCRAEFEQAMEQIEPRVVPTGAPAPAAPVVEKKAALAMAPSMAPLVIYFAHDHDEISASEQTKLAEFIAALKNNSDPLAVLAHADRSGSDAYNDALASRRLSRVVQALEALGIERRRIEIARSYGESNPPVPTADGVRESRNRIVEIRLVQKGS